MESQPSCTFHEAFENRAKGCIVGAMCGDAIGAFLEFKKTVTKEEIALALTLPGGGPHQLGKGQITDDSELLLCLGQALVENKAVLDLDKIAEYYGKWVESKPFDIGMTTRRSLIKAMGAKSDQARLVRKGAKNSLNSKSNGGLMRIAPLCVWCTKLKKDDLIKAVTEEIILSHPNKVTIHVNIVYAYTVRHLLKYHGDFEGAYKKCRKMAKYLENKEIEGWLDDIEKGVLPEGNKNIGFVKIGFCYAIHFLRKNMDFIEAMEIMLIQGGDTDTNCCIAGGILGVLHGFKALPEKIVDRVLAFDPSKEAGIMRPEFLVPGKKIDTIISGLTGYLPVSLEMRGDSKNDCRFRKLLSTLKLFSSHKLNIFKTGTQG